MNESVESDALVIPSSHRPARCRTPAVHDHPLVLLHEPEPVHLLQGLGVAHILDLHLPHHLPDDDLDVLVVDVDALQPVDLLDFVDQVAVQCLLAEDRQDLVRVARPVHQRLARADAVGLLDVHVHAARQRLLSRLAAVLRDDDDLPLPLDDPAVLDEAVDLGDDGRLARLARLEELDHARQTTRNVLRLRGLARDFPFLSRISMSGCFFSSGLSTTIFRDRPVTSSSSSWNVRSLTRSLYFTKPVQIRLTRAPLASDVDSVRWPKPRGQRGRDPECAPTALLPAACLLPIAGVGPIQSTALGRPRMERVARSGSGKREAGSGTSCPLPAGC